MSHKPGYFHDHEREALAGYGALDSFGIRVLQERARMALSDPEGEKEAVKPLSIAQANRLLSICRVLEVALRERVRIVVLDDTP